MNDEFGCEMPTLGKSRVRACVSVSRRWPRPLKICVRPLLISLAVTPTAADILATTGRAIDTHSPPYLVHPTACAHTHRAHTTKCSVVQRTAGRTNPLGLHTTMQQTPSFVPIPSTSGPRPGGFHRQPSFGDMSAQAGPSRISDASISGLTAMMHTNGCVAVWWAKETSTSAARRRRTDDRLVLTPISSQCDATW